MLFEAKHGLIGLLDFVVVKSFLITYHLNLNMTKMSYLSAGNRHNNLAKLSSSKQKRKSK